MKRINVIVAAVVVLLVAGLVLAAIGTVVLLLAAGCSQKPQAPQLRPPTRIVVTLFPVTDFILATPRVEIPATDFEVATRLITPERYYEHGVNDRIIPLIAVVEVTHSDQSKSRLYVRWSGKNPALVSLDGENYFYATNHPDVHDGGMQLVGLATRVGQGKKK